MNAESLIQTANRIYEARRAMVALYGLEKFRAQVAEHYRPAIGHAMARAGNQDVLAAALTLAKELEARPDAKPVMILMVIAAAAEMVEPLP